MRFSTGFLLFLPFCYRRPSACGAKTASPSNGPKATVIRDTTSMWRPDNNSSRLAEISPGREMVMVEKTGPGCVSSPTPTRRPPMSQDAPVFGSRGGRLPISGWMPDAGVVSADTPKGDLILFGAAAGEESAASLPRAPQTSPRQRGSSTSAWPISSPNRRWPPKPPGAPPIYGGNCKRRMSSLCLRRMKRTPTCGSRSTMKRSAS